VQHKFVPAQVVWKISRIWKYSLCLYFKNLKYQNLHIFIIDRIKKYGGHNVRWITVFRFSDSEIVLATIHRRKWVFEEIKLETFPRGGAGERSCPPYQPVAQNKQLSSVARSASPPAVYNFASAICRGDRCERRTLCAPPCPGKSARQPQLAYRPVRRLRHRTLSTILYCTSFQI